MNKEYAEITRAVAETINSDCAGCPHTERGDCNIDDASDGACALDAETALEILALETDTCRIAVVKKKHDLSSLPYPEYSPLPTMDEGYNRGHERGFKCGAIDTINEYVKAGWVEEVII